jgi:glycerate kinase
VLGAELLSGTELVLDRVNFDALLCDGTAAVVTAEGRLDEQSLRNKAPVGVARRACKLGVPTLLIAGSVAPELDLTRTPFFEILVLADARSDAELEWARNHARERLSAVAERVPHVLGLEL